MWFRNLQVFRLTPEWQFSLETLKQALLQHRLLGTGATDRMARGWVPPRGGPDEFVVKSGEHLLIALGTETKLLPGSIVRQHAEEKAREIEQAQGYKPGRKQARDIREQVELELLPRAFTRRMSTLVWIDPVNRWLVVDAASSTRADDVVEKLKETLGELPLRLLNTQRSPAEAMTAWLAAGEAPVDFSIDQDCELQAAIAERPVVRYVRHGLDSDEVRSHITNGKTVTRLGITWRDRVSIVLTDQLQIKRVSFLDVIKDEAEVLSEEGDALFEANFALMAGELAGLLADLVIALGGEAE